MAKAKAKSSKSCGLDPMCHINRAVEGTKKWADKQKEEFKGSPADKVINRKEYVDAAIEADAGTPKPKPETAPDYQASSNQRMKADKEKLGKKSKAEIEAIRKKLQEGKKVKVDET